MNRRIVQGLHNCWKRRSRSGITKGAQGLMVLRKAERQRGRHLQIRSLIRPPRYSTRTHCRRDFAANTVLKPACGVIRVFEGRLRYRTLDHASEVILGPNHPGLVLPDVPHLVEPLGPMRMPVEFYDQPPSITG